MSTEKLKELKLYKKLERDLTYRQKLQQKIRQISSHPSDSPHYSKKLNNNKKYLQQEERNAKIERQNRILFQKIQSPGMKSHYLNNFKYKQRSSKTLDSAEDDEMQKHNRSHHKYNNYSQNKIHYQQEQSRVSFQENQELMRQKKSKPSKKLITELTPEVLELFRSRMVQNRVDNQQTVLFQGIAEIDSIRFKVKIFIKDKTYCLTGKNKHTEIMLKMDIGQYKKFHRQVLFGNPSSIFPFLVIDKGKIRFRTLEEEQLAKKIKQNDIYNIQQQEDEQNYNPKSKTRPSEKSSKHFPSTQKRHYRFEEQNITKLNQNQYQSPTDSEPYEGISVPMRYYKKESHERYYKKESKEKEKKQNILSHMNTKGKGQSQNKRKTESHQKYKTLEDYINDRPEYPTGTKEIKSGESTEVEVRNMKNRYKLPYI